jgi:hypothetical protein
MRRAGERVWQHGQFWELHGQFTRTKVDLPGMRDAADTSRMKQRSPSAELIEEPPPVVFMDRRRTPDRRAAWRGGRRDADWLQRPPGALARMHVGGGSLAGWRSWLTTWQPR